MTSSSSNGNVYGAGSHAKGLEALPITRFGSQRDFEVPDLVELQTKSYEVFLQEEVPPEHRTDTGLESILREVFPIPSYDGTMGVTIPTGR